MLLSNRSREGLLRASSAAAAAEARASAAVLCGSLRDVEVRFASWAARAREDATSAAAAAAETEAGLRSASAETEAGLRSLLRERGTSADKVASALRSDRS